MPEMRSGFVHAAEFRHRLETWHDEMNANLDEIAAAIGLLLPLIEGLAPKLPKKPKGKMLTDGPGEWVAVRVRSLPKRIRALSDEIGEYGRIERREVQLGGVLVDCYVYEVGLFI